MSRRHSRRRVDRRLADLEDEIADPAEESSLGELTPELREAVLDALDDGPYSWDELVERMTDDIEAQLDAALDGLQESNQVRYSGRKGGYTRIGGD